VVPVVVAIVVVPVVVAIVVAVTVVVVPVVVAIVVAVTVVVVPVVVAIVVAVTVVVAVAVVVVAAAGGGRLGLVVVGQPGVAQGRRRRTHRQAALGVAPRPEPDAVVRRIHRQVATGQRLEHLGDDTGGQPGQVVLGHHGRQLRLVARVEPAHVGGQEPEVTGVQRELPVGVDGHERAAVAAVVHPVVHQPDLPAYRHPAAGRVQVCLGGHRVLVVAELVADVCEHFHERDLQ